MIYENNELKTICETSTSHKLHSVWSLYFFKIDNSRKWIDNMHKVYDIDSIESFWGVMHHMRPVSNLTYGCDYYLFRSNIKPMWENEFNKNGGMWVIPSKFCERTTVLNEMWIESLMCLVGESTGDDSDEICGVAINIRGQFDKISIWTRDCRNIQANTRIGLHLKSILNLNRPIEYFSHYDNEHKPKNTSATPTITV